MRPRFLSVSAITNHRNSNMYDSQPRADIKIQGPETKSQKGCLWSLYIMPKNVLPYFVRVIQKLFVESKLNF